MPRIFQLSQLFFHLGLNRDIFNGKESHPWTITLPTNHVGIEEHPLKADPRKIVLDLKVINRVVLGYDLLQQFPKSRDISLAVSKIIDALVLRCTARRPELATELGIRGDHV